MSVRRGVLAFLCVASIFAAPAAAAESARIQHILNGADGSGSMIVNSQTNPAHETWSWQACTANGSDCTSFASGRMIGTGAAAPGTLFTATSSEGATTTSAVWHGNVSAATPPSVSGALRANALVTPVFGTWNGGWDGDRDHTKLAACAGADGSGCISLTDSHFPGSCTSGAALIDPVFTGRYLRVSSQRQGSGAVETAHAVASPYYPHNVTAGPTTSVAMVGRIGPATGPREAACGPPPIPCARSRARSACITAPIATISRQGVARVQCLMTCTVGLRARHGRRNLSVTRSLRDARGGGVELRFSRRALKRLDVKRVRIRVLIDGKQRTRRTVRNPPVRERQ